MIDLSDMLPGCWWYWLEEWYYCGCQSLALRKNFASVHGKILSSYQKNLKRPIQSINQ